MAVFVTGGSGFIGGDLIRSLAADGEEVLALARSAEAAASVTAFGAAAVEGDVFSATAMRAAMERCSVVFHVAGVNELCSQHPASMYRTNVDGTRSVVAAAADAGVRRVVVTSSVVSIGEGPGEVASEQTEHSGVFLSHYARSKKLGEDAAFEEGHRRGVEVVAVNPASVQGPGRTTGSGRLLLYALARRRPFVVAGDVSIVDIADCTAGHRLAAERGEPGRRYLLSGSVSTQAEVARLLGEVANLPIDPIVLPAALVRAVGIPLAGAIALLRRPIPVCPEAVRTMVHGHRVDGSAATAELGLRYRTLEDTLHRAVDWYRSYGLLTRSARRDG